MEIVVKYRENFYVSESSILNYEIISFKKAKTPEQLIQTLNTLRKNPSMHVDELPDWQNEWRPLVKIQNFEEIISDYPGTRAFRYMKILYFFQLGRNAISQITPNHLFFLGSYINNWLRNNNISVNTVGSRFFTDEIRDKTKTYILEKYGDRVQKYNGKDFPSSYFDLDEKIYTPDDLEYAEEHNKLVDELYFL